MKRFEIENFFHLTEEDVNVSLFLSSSHLNQVHNISFVFSRDQNEIVH